MVVFHSRERPFSDVSNIGIAIREVERPPRPIGHHCGFLYKLDGGDPRLLHFAWHYILRDDAPPEAYLWADMGFDEPNGRYVAAYASNLKRNEHNIPYGLDVAGSCFDRESGEFIPPPLGKGLTCATFVSVVLRSLGFNLLQEQTWEARPDDNDFGVYIVEDLKASGAHPDHIDAVSKDIGAKRFRTPEVAGATTKPLSEWPLSFEIARTLATQILADLAAARAG